MSSAETLEQEERRRLEAVAACQSDVSEEFARHPVFEWLDSGPPAQDVRRLLVQRRFLSLAFTPLYDMAIDATDDLDCKNALRDILREEYSPGAPTTHREDLVEDLKSLGVTEEQIRRAAPSTRTRESLFQLFELARQTRDTALHGIQVLSLVWCAGEVLVAEEYQRLWPRLEQLGLSRKSSLFYWPHISHDQPMSSIEDRSLTLEPRGHADRIAECLRDALLAGPPGSAETSCEALWASLRAKSCFYDQFV